MSQTKSHNVKDSVTELTSFQRDLIVSMDNIGPCNGQRISEHMVDVAGYDEVSHGRLYPNLDVLVESGYAHRDPVNRRSNEYKLTNDGLDELMEYRQWVAGDSE